MIPDALVVSVDFSKARPVGGLVRRKAAAYRINAKGEQAIKLFVTGSETQRLACDQVPVESLKVAKVEDNSVPFRNGPVVKRVLPHEPKQIVGDRPGFGEAKQKLAPIVQLGCRRFHLVISPFRL